MNDVRNKLPKAYEMVWVLLDGGINFTKAYVTSSGQWQYNWKVTHWNETKPQKLPHLYKYLNELKK